MRRINKKEQNHNSCDLKYSANSVVLNTLMIDCFLNNASFDHMGHLSFDANAKKSISSRNSSTSFCKNFFAIFREFLNSFLYAYNGTNSTCSFNSENIEARSSWLIFDFFDSSFEYFHNSLSASSGETSSSELSRMSFLVNDSFLKNENNMLVSTTSFNYTNPFSFNSLNLPLRAFFENSMISPSVNSLFFNNNFSFSNSSCFLSLSSNIPLATSDQFIQENFCISCLDFSSIDNVMLTIYSSPSSSSNFFNFLILSFIPILNISDQLSSGYLPNLFFNSFEIDNVTFGILTPLYSYKRKDVNVYKNCYHQKGEIKCL